MKRYKKASTRTGKYKSKLEETVAKALGKNAQYEVDVIQYVLPKGYKPDFTVVKKDGTKLFIEVKGWFRYEDQAKMKAVKFSNPTLDIRMYFPVDGKVQGSKMKNSEWCNKYGFPFAIGTVPKGWKK